jgi:hypothetical protein
MNGVLYYIYGKARSDRFRTGPFIF